MTIRWYEWGVLATVLAAGPAAGEVAFEGGVVATYLQADQGAVDDEAFASADLVALIPAGNGEWTIYVEGNTTPKDSGVANLIPEANGDAGSALDKEGNGRIQVSELHYTMPLAVGALTAGLLDVTGFMDGSDVANDEGMQFLGASFVNNPTIGFPDYTLGLALQDDPEEGLGYALLLTGSHGIGDNTDADYEQLVDMSDDGKGVFAAAELRAPLAESRARVGLWHNSADHDYLDGSGETAANFGAYASIDGRFAGLDWNLRLGGANGKVSPAAAFAALAVAWPVRDFTVGLGVARILASDDLAGGTDTNHAEAYARIPVTGNLAVTPTLQWVENPGLTEVAAGEDNSVFVSGLRVDYAF